MASGEPVFSRELFISALRSTSTSGSDTETCFSTWEGTAVDREEVSVARKLEVTDVGTPKALPGGWLCLFIVDTEVALYQRFLGNNRHTDS